MHSFQNPKTLLKPEQRDITPPLTLLQTPYTLQLVRPDTTEMKPLNPKRSKTLMASY